ncbi:DUF1214 domain-containing protein [Mycobacterium sp. SMC-4]|uniref:DUF1214 domain-containing protein n=1 Tax=Mycobacterium sp. SMC-4 TaxID=2857059 RepID=UPI003D06C640
MSDDSWQAFADGVRAAGEGMAEATADLDATDRADGQRALVCALNNLLGRLETNRDRPELVSFNGWRQKFFMDNPDYRYWITDIRDDRSYRIVGNVGESVYQSVTVYSGTSVADAAAVARLDRDGLGADAAGNFSITLSANDFDGLGLKLPAGSTSVWVRYVHQGTDPAEPGWCRIDSLDADSDVPGPRNLDKALSRLGRTFAQLPKVLQFAVADDVAAPNAVRHWSAMAGGAAFTEPGIHYVRGAWELGDDEALILEGLPPACRHWNIVLYNRFLNSLDYRYRTVSRTGASVTLSDGGYRFSLAARDPGIAGYDWLDTEGRHFGVFVMRFLHAATPPELPVARRVSLGELR